MIEGHNSTLGNTFDYEYEDISKLLGTESTTDKVVESLITRRKNVLEGGVNCIPLPFQRFRSEIPGIEQGQYCILTANQKVGKSMLASYLYLYTALDYAFNNPDKCSVHIIYFALEESVQRVVERYMSHLLFQLDKIRISPSDLRSTSVDYVIPEEILDKLKSDRYQERLRFFEKCVQFETEDTNPTGILRICEAYAKSVGQYKSHKIPSKGINQKEVEVFDSYIQNDPNHYKIVIVDHIGLVDKEQGFKLKDSMDKLSEYFVKYLRNRYNFTCVAIQQQASEAEGLEAIKQKRMIPAAASLADTKYTSRDANLVIGLFDPSKFGLSSWLGYKIQDADGSGLKNYARFLYVIANRDGEMGGICPLYFDGAVCEFEELPKPDNINALDTYYAKAQNNKSYRQQRKAAMLSLLMFFKKIAKRINLL